LLRQQPAPKNGQNNVVGNVHPSDHIFEEGLVRRR
jgi:hypothetical protein